MYFESRSLLSFVAQHQWQLTRPPCFVQAQEEWNRSTHHLVQSNSDLNSSDHERYDAVEELMWESSGMADRIAHYTTALFNDWGIGGVRGWNNGTLTPFTMTLTPFAHSRGAA